MVGYIDSIPTNDMDELSGKLSAVQVKHFGVKASLHGSGFIAIDFRRIRPSNLSTLLTMLCFHKYNHVPMWRSVMIGVDNTKTINSGVISMKLCPDSCPHVG